VGALERQDQTVIVHCLRAYAAIDNSAGAEEAFRSAVVVPFVQRIIFSQPAGVAVTPRGDKLEEVFKEIKVHVQTDCQFLLDKAAAGIDYFFTVSVHELTVSPYLSLTERLKISFCLQG